MPLLKLLHIIVMGQSTRVALVLPDEFFHRLFSPRLHLLAADALVLFSEVQQLHKALRNAMRPVILLTFIANVTAVFNIFLHRFSSFVFYCFSLRRNDQTMQV